MTPEQLQATLTSLMALPDQILEVLNHPLLALPDRYHQVNQVVVSGMGGSNLGARILASAFADSLRCPISVSAGYEAPAFVNEQTLFVLSSYSGSTEETLASYQTAKARGAQCLVITAQHENNQLLALAERERLPVLAFPTTHNPSGQPRLGLGYACFALATVLRQLNLLTLEQTAIEQACAKLKLWGQPLSDLNLANDAKKIAAGLKNKQIVLVAGEFLAGNIHALRNQFNENAKTFASYLVLPDLNHHAMEGLVKPDSNKQDLIFCFFDSELYHPRVQTRSKLTKQVVAKNGLAFVDIKLLGDNKLEQTLELLQLGAWITLYLALENQVNLLEIPWVDWFKQELAG